MTSSADALLSLRRLGTLANSVSRGRRQLRRGPERDNPNTPLSSGLIRFLIHFRVIQRDDSGSATCFPPNVCDDSFPRAGPKLIQPGESLHFTVNRALGEPKQDAD